MVDDVDGRWAAEDSIRKSVIGWPVAFSVTRPESEVGVGSRSSTFFDGAVRATGALSIAGVVLEVEAVIDTCPAASPLSVKVPSAAETALRPRAPRTAMVAPPTGVPSFGG